MRIIRKKTKWIVVISHIFFVNYYNIDVNIVEINKLLRQKQDISAQQASFAMEEILNGRLDDEQLADFITLLHAKGETSIELASLVHTMWENSPSVDIDAMECLDTCGTGGDKSGTFNISTAVSIVLAAIGIKIAKHGNRAASSNCGAADVLEELGVPVTYSPESAGIMLEKTGFTFLFAPTFHPGMRFAAPVRKSLGVPTTFNYLGPLANPLHAHYRMHGISNPRLLETYTHTLKELGIVRALVFHGHNGLDEIALSGPSAGFHLQDGIITRRTIDPKDYGFDYKPTSDLIGGDACRNAEIITEIFAGISSPSKDVVVLNAAIAYELLYPVDRDESVDIVEKTIQSGAVATKLREISETAKSLCESTN